MRKITFLTIAFISFFGSNKVFSQDAENTIHQIGEKFGGGMVLYLKEGSEGKHGLIMGEKDLSWDAKWSSNNEEIGAKSSSDGVANTNAIIKAGGAEKEAAGICHAYNEGGFTDWYLPSIDEIELICKSIGGTNWTSTYLSSTEVDAKKVKGYKFSSCTSVTVKKSEKCAVRPIRAF